MGANEFIQGTSTLAIQGSLPPGRRVPSPCPLGHRASSYLIPTPSSPLPFNTGGMRTALAERFRLGTELGSGGTSVVFLADNPETGERLAVKVLRPEFVDLVARER